MPRAASCDTGYDYDHVMKVLPFEKPIQSKDQTIPGALGPTQKSLGNPVPSLLHNNPVAGVESMRRVKNLAEDKGAELMFSHDMENFQTYRTGTQYYG